MKIETLFEVGDKCYFIRDNIIKKGQIFRIEITVLNDIHLRERTTICYRIVHKGDHSLIYGEDVIFKSVEDALTYLEIHVVD